MIKTNNERQLLWIDRVSILVGEDLSQAEQLEKDLQSIGIPFSRLINSKSEADKYQISNLWVGDQFIELVRYPKKPENYTAVKNEVAGYKSKWVQEYFENSKRGANCIFIGCTDLSAIHKRIKTLSEETAVRFSMYQFLVLNVKSPWKVLYLKQEIMPGGLEIAFIEYDAGELENMKEYMVPNAKEQGIAGIQQVQVFFGDYSYFDKLVALLEDIFEKSRVEVSSKKNIQVKLSHSQYLYFFYRTGMKTTEAKPFKVEVKMLTSNEEKDGSEAVIENVKLETVSPSSEFELGQFERLAKDRATLEELAHPKGFLSKLMSNIYVLVSILVVLIAMMVVMYIKEKY